MVYTKGKLNGKLSCGFGGLNHSFSFGFAARVGATTGGFLLSNLKFCTRKGKSKDELVGRHSRFPDKFAEGGLQKIANAREEIGEIEVMRPNDEADVKFRKRHVSKSK